MTTPTTIACPTCGAPVQWSTQSPNRPFCSERCKLIDLGAWAAGEHAIPGDPVDDEMFSSDLTPREH
jgi:endogenous inhibitor of DNA gyrase (YacG/DUF329 family)